MKKIIPPIIMILLANFACTIPTEPSPATAAPSNPTTPTTSPPATDPVINPDPNGVVNGTVCFPSEFIPEMTIYLQEINTNNTTEVNIAENQNVFSQQVPSGTYIAYAWLLDFSIGGSYSQAVPCGLSVNCIDHSLIQFPVGGGQTVSGIDVCDWYGDPNSVPYPPNFNPATLVGAIEGNLGYPSEYIPSMTVVAFNIDTNGWFYIYTNEGDNSYFIGNLPPGNYQVVAYANVLAGGYTLAVPCGLSVNCPDHSRITFSVVAGQTTSGIDPLDWYASQAAFPANPAP
ncbi:MAG: carboxypeptidase regulatory-like domain-containing protein [Chloroflexi bacterium]|nr:carboxypeptidase regulatory-like domain-containing protein [Chloroflexota bacterium]